MSRAVRIEPAGLLRSWDDHDTGGGPTTRPVLLHHLPPDWRGISTAVVGGGIGPVGAWLNAQVSRYYAHPDPAAHAVAIAAELGVAPGTPAVVMLTAADAARFTLGEDDGVQVVATVGLGLPVPAAAPDEVDRRSYRPGTINLLVAVPVPLADAALVNAVVTATEAKTQALVEAGVPGTGTSSDAVCVVCPAPGAPGAGPVEPYGGPRSLWGARLARAVHRAVADGTADWTAAHPPGDEHRRWGGVWPGPAADVTGADVTGADVSWPDPTAEVRHGPPGPGTPAAPRDRRRPARPAAAPRTHPG